VIWQVEELVVRSSEWATGCDLGWSIILFSLFLNIYYYLI
jgi:hypothetical protein